MDLGATGIWSGELRYGDRAATADAVAELEALGFGAIWIPDIGGDLIGSLEHLLAATRTMIVATGILNIWMHEPDVAAAEFARLTATFGDRLLYGLGVSHQLLIDGRGPGTYDKPYSKMIGYLDALDAATTPVPVDRRVLAALRPKMLATARERSAGAHPYLVTSEHVALAREALGPDRLLAPELAVVLTDDAERARTAARAHLAGYLLLPNYTGNWLRLGFEESDLDGGGSDRLVDALVAWGDDAAIAARVAEFREAGADHVCLQALGGDGVTPPIEDWRRLAALFLN